jgi:hypothetical protein
MLNMKVDNPQAFRFIMQDEIYLLDKDKSLYASSSVANALEQLELPQVEEGASAIILTSPQVLVAEPPLQPAPLISQPQTPLPVVQTTGSEFNYLGKNNKNFLILVNYTDDEHMTAPHLAALQNILMRKDLELDDVAILNVSNYKPVKLTALATYFAPIRLVIMGKDALPEGIGNLPLNQPLQGKKTHVLYSFSFDEMMSSNDNKKVFWEHMKTL